MFYSLDLERKALLNEHYYSLELFWNHMLLFLLFPGTQKEKFSKNAGVGLCTVKVKRRWHLF